MNKMPTIIDQHKIFLGVLIVLGIFGSSTLIRLIAKNYISDVTAVVEIEVATTSRALPNTPAPTFSLETLSGKFLTTEELRGEPAVLIFWTSWNQVSVDQLSIVDKMNTALFPGVRFVAINVQEDRSIVESFMKRTGYNMEILIDETGRISEKYHAYSLPATFIVDRSGMIRHIDFGTLSTDALQGRLENVLR